MKMKNLFRFCSLMLSWAVCVNVFAQFAAPVVTSNPDACDSAVKFTIGNYDSSLSYTWRVNGAVVSASNTYTVNSPVEGVTYTAVVEATDGASKQSSTPVSQTYRKTPAKPTVSVNAFSCDAQVQFTIAPYDASAAYTWTINGVAVPATGSTYTIASPQDRETYKATVVAEKNGCASQASAAVERLYLSTPEKAQITTIHDCGLPITYKLNNTYPASYTQVWKVNNTTVLPQNGEYTLNTYSDNVTYTLEVSVTNTVGGQVCKSTSDPAKVVAKVSPSSPVAPGYRGCADEGSTGSWESLVNKASTSYTLNWYDSFLSTSPIVPPVNFDKGAVGTISYWVSQVNSATGCESGKTEVKVIVDAVPEANAGDDLIICEGESVVLAEGLSDDPNVIYTWTPSGKLTSVNTHSVTTQPLTTDTEFKLKVANASATTCYSEDKVKVTVLKKPQVVLSPSKFTICEDGTVTLQNTKADPTKESYYWETITNGVSNYVGGNADLTLTSLSESATIKLTATLDDLGTCSTSKEAEVTVIKRPVADAGPEKFVCSGNSVQIGTNGVTGVNYSWSPTTNLNNSRIATPTVTNVTADVKYTLTATSSAVANCESTSEVWVYKVDRPTKYTLSGGGSYCQGTAASGVSISLSNSDSDTQYDLVKDGVSQDQWTVGLNNVLEWTNVTAGSYRVKARKVGFNTCEEYMNGTVVVQAVQSPSAQIMLLNSNVACPGDEVTVRVKISGGGPLYDFTLLTNGVAQEINGSGSIYDFTYKTDDATKFEISKVSDAVCTRVYDIADYPTLVLDMANVSDFKIYSSNNDKPVCYGSQVTLKIDYNDPMATYRWQDGSTSNSISVHAAADATYELYVTTPEGCEIPCVYNLEVIEKTPVKLGPELYKKNNMNEFVLCSNDDPVTPSATPAGGKFTSNPAGLIVQNQIRPSVVTADTKRYDITYQYTDPASGCVQDTTFALVVSALNKSVNWTVGPTNEEPKKWTTNEFVKCQPDPNNPKEVIQLQGSPATPGGKWILEKVVNSGGGTVTTTNAEIVVTNANLSQAKLVNVIAGETYFISYVVPSQNGCEGKSLKTIKIDSNPTTYIESGGINILPSDTICIKDTIATIFAAQNPGKFKLASTDAAMFVQDTSDGRGLIINPSKGKAGSHTVIYEIAHPGCSYKEEFTFNISNPVAITSYDLPKKEFCETEDPFVIGVNAVVPTTGEIEVINQEGVTVLNKTNIEDSPIFNPAWGEGKYNIFYYYSDGTCDSEYVDSIQVYATPVIDFKMKDNYCFGEKIVIVPNYAGGTITIDPLLPAETLKGNVFYTEYSGKGTFTIDYEVTDSNGCVGTASKKFQVRGVENMWVQVDTYFCEPYGAHAVEGFPKPLNSQDSIYFSTEPAIGLTDNGDGTAIIDLVNSTYNATYPITYHYVEKFVDAAGNPDACETTITKNFMVLDQTADFSGYKNAATICSDVLRIELTANLKDSTTFEFSDALLYPTAFVDNGDGTAVLFPSELPEGYYSGVTMTHKYYDADGNIVCKSEKTKSFRISKIEEVTDIELFCDSTNKTAVRLKNTELDIRYDLYVNNANYDSHTTTAIGEKVSFKAIDIPTSAFASVYVVAVEPNTDACSRKMSKEFYISPLHATVESTNITCFGREDGTFKGAAQGGITPYSHKLVESVSAAEVIQAESSIVLAKGAYTYVVTDSIGCYHNVPFEINEPNKLEAVIQQTDVDCFGATTATLNAQVLSNAGVGPYTYEWTKIDPVKGDSVVTNIASAVVDAGEYYIKIEDANGCVWEDYTTVYAPLKELTVKLESKQDVQIRGNATGAIDITVEGGTPDAVTGYTFIWSGNGITDTNKYLEDQQDLVAGTYAVTVIDSKGCKATLSVIIYEPTEIHVEQVVKDTQCAGDANGVISLNIVGGTTPYYIRWEDAAGNLIDEGEGLNEISGLVAAEYKYIITDNDGNTLSDFATVGENAPLKVTTSLLSELENKCYGNEDAYIILEIAGGTGKGTYKVNWLGLDPAKLESDTKAVNLPATTYTIDIEDKNKCNIQHVVTVTQPALEFGLKSVTVVQNICHDGAEGSIDIELQGGTPNYTYIWQGDGVNPSAEDQVGLKAGKDYSVKVYDANGCMWEDTFTMENPAELTLSLSAKDITCKGAKNGTIEATVTGEMPFTYAWTDPTGTATFANVHKIDCEIKGRYSVEVTDKLGCTKTDGVDIYEPTEVTGRVEITNITCNDENDGKVRVYAEGGSGIFTYALYKVGEVTPISTSNEQGRLEGGAYQYKVLDENACAWTSPVIHIDNPAPIEIVPVVSNVTINGLSNGAIDLDITGGTQGLTGYTIQWLNGPSIVTDPADAAYNADQEIITNLKAGRYTVVVTDANNCAATIVVEVTQPEVITLDIDVTDVRCYADANGKILLSNIAGGTGNYTITWVAQNSGNTYAGTMIDQLPADIYELKVVDDAGAEFTKEIEVKQPDEIVIRTVPELSRLSVDCFGSATGEITVDITGGNAPYVYNWVGVSGSNVDTVTGLTAGTYGIILTDSKNCMHNSYKETIKGPVGKLDITETIVENKCYGEANAQIEIQVSGGTAPYTYLWTGAGLDAAVVNDQNQYHLYNGNTYKVTVIDALNCTLDRVYNLEERFELLVATSSKDVLCYRDRTGELHATVSGGTGPLSYIWESEDASYSSTVLDITDLYAGKYSFTVQDSIGCVVVREEEINEPDSLLASITGSSALCGGIDDGELYVDVKGGTQPYTYVWQKDYDTANPVGFGAHLTNLGAGEYEIFIEDRNKCKAYDKTTIRASVPMQIIPVEKIDVTIYGGNDGVIEIDATGGTAPLTFTWSGPTIDPNAPVTGKRIEDLVAGYYNVTVEDAVGCKITERIEITQPETITPTAEIKNIKCAGDKGKILLRVTGGTAPYTFDWTGPNGYVNNTQETEITDLQAGIYYVTITDARGAQTLPRQYTIDHKEPLTWKLLESKTALDCYNENDANINIHVEGGTYPYSIKWTGPNFTANDVQSIGKLGIGTYKAEISDANGCKPADIFVQEITQPDEIKITDVITHNNCSSDKNGAIDITVEGGVPQYAFAWSGFNVKSDSEDQIDLPKGIYYLTFTDGNGCQVNKEYKVNANNEISAIISGPSNICSAEEFEVQIDVNGLAPWTIEYTDGTQVYTENTENNTNKFTHSLLTDSEFKLISVVDANGCYAKLGESLIVDVHELPQITIVSAQEDCCLGEPALMDIIFAGKGPWTISYTDGTLDYVDGPFTADRDYLKIIPTQIGTKTYTIKTVSNENCTVPVDYSVDITAYTYPNLEVNVAPYICEPNPLQVSLHATGEAPWHLVYYLNDLKYEYDMQAEDEIIDIYPNKPENVFVFESIKSGKRCLSKLDKTIQSEMGLLPLDATVIMGQNMVCRNSVVSFSTVEIPYATSYDWSLPTGFTIVSGLGSNSIQVEVADDATDGEVRVWGVNNCGEGVYTAINVQVDKPMSAGAQISMPPYVCDDETIFPLSVSEVENATNYEWVMPTGYHILSGQGTRSIMVQIDKYALSSTVEVVPSNMCTEASPIKAKVDIRPLPFAEAGVDFITNCSAEAVLMATNNVNAVTSEWRLVSGNAEFENASLYNTKVSALMYGDNVLAWNIDDGYCVGYDLVTVTNQNPGITDPEFSELTICEDFMTLRAGKPEFGMGRWTLIAGDGEIQNPNSNETLITGLSNKRPNVIRWEVYSPQCSNSINVEVISHDLNQLADAGADGVSTTGSYRLSARVVNDSKVTGTWTVVAGEGTIEDPHNPNTYVNGLATGINTLRWTLTGYDCQAYDEIKIRMIDEPIASFNIETTEGCVPLTVQFTNTTIGSADYKWEFGDGSTSDLRSPIHIFENPGTYTVKLTASANGRVDSYTGQVKVLPSPEAAFSVAERQLYVPNAEAHFYNETEEAVNHFWMFGDGGTSDKPNPVYTYLADGIYDITYIVSDINLCSDTLVMENFIRVGKDSYLVFPTAFTPNVERSNGGLYSEGERRLDIFYPVGRHVDTYKLEIFSSWGNKVFESNDQYIGWDGYYMGQCAAQGTYFYKAEGRFKDGNAFQYSGNLILIR